MSPRRHNLVRRRWAPRGSGAAFTLVELLVTIGIIGFVLAATIVAFAPMFRTSGVDGAAHVVRASVDGARVRAIQQRRQVRFEAQLVPGSTTHTWQVTSSAGELSPKWDVLPDFVALATNVAGSGSHGVDGLLGTYVGSLGQPDADAGNEVQSISITFGPDGSVRRYVLGGQRQVNASNQVSYSPLTPGETTEPFAIRLTNMREATAGQPTVRRWVSVFPLTGGLQSYDTDGAN